MFGGTAAQFSYSHNAAGLLSSITYPSGRVVTNSYDTVGRVGSVLGVLAGAPRNYAGVLNGAPITYFPHGAVQQINLGNTLYETWAYNTRLQPTGISLGVSAGSASVRGITPGYGSAEDNGNVLTEGISGAGLSGAASQSYAYDAANRILSGGEGSNNAAWSRSFQYDLWGNNWVSGGPSNFSPTAFTPQANAYDAGTNHSSVNGAIWDAAGRERTIGGFG